MHLYAIDYGTKENMSSCDNILHVRQTVKIQFHMIINIKYDFFSVFLYTASFFLFLNYCCKNLNKNKNQLSPHKIYTKLCYYQLNFKTSMIFFTRIYHIALYIRTHVVKEKKNGKKENILLIRIISHKVSNNEKKIQVHHTKHINI